MKAREKISYPELGHVYKGDYYEDIPYDAYIRKDQEASSDHPIFDIRDFGAIPGDGLNTQAIRQACEACRDAGGGTVLVKGGSYRTGTVRLYDHTTLFIAPDSELVASRNAEDLVTRIDGTQDFGEESSGGAFILALDARNVSLTGGGVIHGQGEWFVHEPRKRPALEPFPLVMLPRRDQADQINTVPRSIRTEYRDRIRYAEDKYREGKPILRRPSSMVWFLRCQNVRVENLILRDSMCWTLHVESSDEILLRNIVIDDNRHVANTDGIDLSGCRHVQVEHCLISCADDGLCIKNPVFTHRTSEHITIRDCRVITVMNAFKIGTGTRFDIRNILVENCLFEMPDIYPGSVSGISIESCDGSHVSDVTLRNIRMKKVQCPLYIVLNRRNQAGEPYSDDAEAPYWGGGISHVTLEKIYAEDADLPAIVTGYADTTSGGNKIRKAPRDIRISDYTVTYRDCEEHVSVPETFEEFLVDYPECNAHGDVDAFGIWVRHADDVKLENIRVIPRSCNMRQMIVMSDVRSLKESV